MRESLPAPPLPLGHTVTLLLPALAMLSVKVVPAGKLRTAALGKENVNSVGVVAEFGGVMLLVTVVL